MNTILLRILIGGIPLGICMCLFYGHINLRVSYAVWVLNKPQCV